MKYVFFYIMLFLVCKSAFSLRPDTTDYIITPAHFGLTYREITFFTEDNVYLKGWLIPAQPKVELDSNNLPAFYKNPIDFNYSINDYSPKKTVVICSGDGGNMCYGIWMANEFLAGGYNVFMFDWRGFGKSQSWEMDYKKLAIPEFLIDYKAAIKTLDTLPEVDNSKICLYGFSTGFYLSFATAVTNSSVKCLAGRGLITNFEDSKKCLVVKKDTSQVLIPKDYPRELLPDECAKKLKVPVFIIVGENDEITPPWMSKKIYKAIRCRKKLKIVPEEDHCTVEVNHRLTIFKEICEFYDSVVDPDKENSQ